MKKLLFLFCISSVFMVEIVAQVGAYSFSASSGTFTPIVGGTDADDVEADDILSSVIPIGFNFVFDGVTYTDLKVSSNGFITFNTASTNSQSGNNLDGVIASSRPIIAPLWDDLAGQATDSTSKASYVVTGTAPNRVFTFEWLYWEWRYNSSSTPISFQAKLYETTNVVEFVYQQESGTPNTPTASIGLTGTSSFLSLDGTGTNPNASNTSETANLNTKPATGQVYTFTPPNCLAPNNLLTSGIYSDSATISWTSSGATDWIVEYGTAGFTLGTGTMMVLTDTFTNLTSLMPNTEYEWYIREVCAVGDSSAWVGPNSFTTPCAILTPYYEANFTTFLPGCWDEATSGTGATGPTGLGSGDWVGSSVLATNTAKVNLYNVNTSDWLVAPSFDLSMGGYELLVEVAVTNYNTSNPGVMGSDDFVEVFYSEDGTTWNSLVSWTVADNLTNSLTPIILPLSSTGANVQFAILGSEGSVDDPEDYDFHIGKFVVRTIPTCSEPITLMTSDVASDSAVISWTTGGATSWIVEYDTAGFTQGSGNIQVITTDTFTSLTGLLSNTAYEWYVRDFCGAGDSSAWVGPNSFTTLCNAFTTPYTENFDAATSIPSCWMMSGSENWIFASNGGHVGNAGTFGSSTSGSNFAYVDDSSPDNTGTTLMSPLIDVSSLTSPGIFFNLISNNEGNSNVTMNVDVYDGAAWNNALYTNSSNTALGDWEQKIIDISGLTITGPIQVRFVVDELTSGDFYDDIAIDDFQVDELPSCLLPTMTSTANVGSISADLLWTTGGASDWIVEYGPTGFAQGSGTVVSVTGTDSLNLATLTANTSYEWYVRDFCGAGDSSAWVGPNSFTTLCNAFTTPYTENFDAATSIPSCWMMSGSENWIFASNGGHVGNAGTFGSSTSGSNFAYVDDSSPDNTGTTLMSPLIDVSSLTTPAIIFNLISNNEGNSNVTMNVDVYDGAAWNNALYTNSSNTALGDWEQKIIDISGLTITGPIQVRFVVDELTSGDFYDDIAIDDFQVDELPSCNLPTMASTINITSTSADLLWTTGGATDWIVEYGLVGFAQGSGTVVPVTGTDSLNLATLTANTSYDWYVRDFCGAGDSSAWVGPLNFYTGHCIPSPSTVDGNGITNVSMGTINNATGVEPNNYGDYSAMITDVGQGVDFDIDITLETGFTYNLWAWIDWNNDLDFDDPNEEIYLGESTSSNPTTLNATISIPATVSLGNHLIRLGGADSGLGSTSPSNPCYTGTWGSFEDYTLNVIACNGAVVTEPTDLCDGDTLTLSDGTEVTTSGMYTDSITLTSGCDSIVTYDVTVVMPVTFAYSDTICDGDTLAFGTQMLTMAGMYTEDFVGPNGCDSTVTLTLQINTSTNDTLDVTICDGDTYMFGTQMLTTAGVYSDIFVGVNGCDSITTLNLFVNNTSTGALTASICDGDSYTFGSQTLTSAGTYNENFTNSNGCDSTVTLTLNVLSSSSITLSATICANEVYVLGSQNLTSSGTFTENFISANGCDSSVTVNLTVNPTSTAPAIIDIVLCDSLVTYTLADGDIINSVGMYNAIISSQNGCDSTITYNVTRCQGVGITGVDNNVDFLVYPNPANQLLNIEFNEQLSKENSIIILNVMGQKVYSTINTRENKLTINTDNLPSGKYFISVLSDNKKSVKTFAVVK